MASLDKRKAPLRPIPSYEQQNAFRLSAKAHKTLCADLAVDPGRLDCSIDFLLGPGYTDDCLPGLKQADPDFLEVYLLAGVSALLRDDSRFDTAPNGPALQADFLDAIGRRVLEVLRRCPALAHPELHVPFLHVGFNSSGRKVKFHSLFAHLVKCSVQLDPAELAEVVRQHPSMGEHIARTVADDSSAWLSNCLSMVGRSSKLARALLRVTSECWRQIGDISYIHLLAKRCGMACRTQHSFEDATAFLDALHAAQRATDGNGAGFACRLEGLADALAGNDVPQAEHPVFVLLAEAGDDAAVLGPVRAVQDGMPQVAGYPEKPLAALADRINRLLLPGDRLPLECVPAKVALDLVTITVDRFWHINFQNFKTALEGGASQLPTRTPLDLQRWAIERRDDQGRQVQVDDVDQEKVQSAIGSVATARLMALLTERSMNAVLDGIPCASPRPPSSTGSRSARAL